MTFYLSKLEPNPRSKKVRRDLTNAYELHRTLARGTAEAERRLLWRVDGGKHPYVLVQTLDQPDWSYLIEEVPPAYLLGPPQVKPVTLSFAAGQRLRFRLRANPTVKRTVGDVKKRLALRSEDEQLAWLHRKAAAGGFEVLEATVLAAEWLEFPRNRTQVSINAVDFDGHIEVVDPDVLMVTVRNGLGSAKGFGMGLLSLAAAS